MEDRVQNYLNPQFSNFYLTGMEDYVLTAVWSR